MSLLVLLSSVVLHAASAIKTVSEDEYCKVNQRHPSGLTYRDHRGADRLLSNNHCAMYTRSFSDFPGVQPGDYVLIDIDTWTLVANFDLENHGKEKEECLKNSDGHTTYYVSKDEHKKDKQFQGLHFFDRKTENEFVIRRYYSAYYYVDIKTGLIVRETDYQINQDILSKKWDYHRPDKSIDDINEEIKKAQKMLEQLDVTRPYYVSNKNYM